MASEPLCRLWCPHLYHGCNRTAYCSGLLLLCKYASHVSESTTHRRNSINTRPWILIVFVVLCLHCITATRESWRQFSALWQRLIGIMCFCPKARKTDVRIAVSLIVTLVVYPLWLIFSCRFEVLATKCNNQTSLSCCHWARVRQKTEFGSYGLTSGARPVIGVGAWHGTSSRVLWLLSSGLGLQLAASQENQGTEFRRPSFSPLEHAWNSKELWCPRTLTWDSKLWWPKMHFFLKIGSLVFCLIECCRVFEFNTHSSGMFKSMDSMWTLHPELCDPLWSHISLSCPALWSCLCAHYVRKHLSNTSKVVNLKQKFSVIFWPQSLWLIPFQTNIQ